MGESALGGQRLHTTSQSPGGVAMPEKKTFFISRAGADKRWAELIASVVRDAGHEAIHQEDFRIGASFIHNMRAASANSDCTITVLSPAYFESKYCQAELNAALAADPNGLSGNIFPVRIAPCQLPPDLAHLRYLDLVDADNDTARHRLMAELLKEGKLDGSQLALGGRTRRAVEKANRNRTAMIKLVRTTWITGILQKSLFHEIRLILGLAETSDAVTPPMDLVVQRPKEGERLLPHGTQIVDLFDQMNQALLILGAPGAGKTMLLLELTRELLDRSERNSEHPIPVVFPLSTWSQSRKPLAEWMVNELHLRYDVPRAIGQDWVKTNEILPLLDGLDEVTAEQRVACVDAINAFRHDHGLLPLVITSRVDDYQNLTLKLRLQGAVKVQPLTQRQVTIYLEDLGSAGEPVRRALREQPRLWELLDTPLMLNIIAVNYSGLPEAPSQAGTLGERRDRMFKVYVDRMLGRPGVKHSYTCVQTVRWLSWLAAQMANHGQTVFYLERLQPGWAALRLPAAVIPSYHRGEEQNNPDSTVEVRANSSLAYRWGVWLRRALTNSTGKLDIENRRRSYFPGVPYYYSLIKGLILMVIGGMFGAITMSLVLTIEMLYADSASRDQLIGSFVYVGAFGVFVGLSTPILTYVWTRYSSFIDSLSGSTKDDNDAQFSEIKLVENVEVMWIPFMKSALIAVPITMISFPTLTTLAGLCVAVIKQLNLREALKESFIAGMCGGVLVCGAVLVNMFLEKISIGEIDIRTIPNQGIHRTAGNAIVSGLVVGFVVAVVAGLAVGVVVRYFFGVHSGIICGSTSGMGLWLVVGLFVGLRTGGHACIYHLGLRLFLIHHRLIPWNYVGFLDYAADRILLRKVGGGYAFIHRMLLEYFAARYVERSDKRSPASKPIRLGDKL